MTGLNTTGSLQGETWNDGDVIYLSPFTAGSITNIKPTAPNHTVILGYVVYSHQNNGKIYVKIDNGYEIGELHNCYLPSPNNNDSIFWSSTNARYENKSIATVLGFTPENVANKSTDTSFTANSDTLYPSQKAVKAYADSLVTGLLDDRGNYDASSNLFPSTGGSGSGGAILKGDIWFISVTGTLGGTSVAVGSSVRALVDSPGQTSSNWSILNVGVGYTPENSANKSSSYTVSSTTTYPNTKALVDGLASKINTVFLQLGQTAGTLFNPADATTYYFGTGIPVTSSVIASRLITLPIGITITDLSVNTWVNGVAASNELISLYVEEATTTGVVINSTLLTSSYTMSNVTKQNSLVINGLNINIISGNCILIKMITPTWATNPTNIWTSFLINAKI